MTIVCVNCGGCGHVYKNCTQPITSYGVVCYRRGAGGEAEFLIVQRRDSFAYVDFVRGKYDIRNRRYVQRLFRQMTSEERRKVGGMEFDDLWLDFWNKNAKSFSRPDYQRAKDQFSLLRRGVKLRLRGGSVAEVTMRGLLEETPVCREEPEWGFPKGRRSHSTETDVQCAFRELEEETRVAKSDLICISRKPLEELYTGDNGVRYKHVYYMARLNPGADVAVRVCNREIRSGIWAAGDRVLDLMRERRERCEVFRRIMKAAAAAPA